ncbi:MAG: hypothetical protein ACP5RI_03580 [Candidatus Micrarchaeia archaeon]
MKAKEKIKKEEADITNRACFIELATLDDLGRYLMFTNINKGLFSIAENNAMKIFISGPKIKDKRLLFYYKVEGKNKAKYLIYKPEDGHSKKISEVSDETAKEQQATITQVPIIPIEKIPYKEDKLDKVTCINVVDYEAMIKIIIARSINDDSIGKIYMFNTNNTYFIASFALLGSDDSNILYYAKINNVDPTKGFFQYDYSEDSISQTNIIDNTSKLYLRIIYLKKEFPFFKPE